MLHITQSQANGKKLSHCGIMNPITTTDKNYSGQPRMVVLGVEHFPRNLKSLKHFF